MKFYLEISRVIGFSLKFLHRLSVYVPSYCHFFVVRLSLTTAGHSSLAQCRLSISILFPLFEFSLFFFQNLILRFLV